MDAIEYWQTVGQAEQLEEKTWYGYSKEEYYALVYQPGDPEWENLTETAE